jgi:hypothetical protein
VANRLERLRHHRDADRLLDLANHRRVRHPRDTALGADVGGDPLERHHRAGARVLGDPRLLCRGHVHDHPAFEHLGEAGLQPECRALGHPSRE